MAVRREQASMAPASTIGKRNALRGIEHAGQADGNLRQRSHQRHLGRRRSPALWITLGSVASACC